jgi:hypothetical protein
MAMADYAKCGRCGGKAFYDANISDPAYCATWDPSEETPAIGIAVLCATCATTHEAVIRPRGQLAHERRWMLDLIDRMRTCGCRPCRGHEERDITLQAIEEELIALFERLSGVGTADTSAILALITKDKTDG